MFVTCGTLCYRITSEGGQVIEALQSSQEEADTRMLLHAKHAAQAGCKSVIIASEDTDVLVLCLALASQIPCSIYQKHGTKTKMQYLDIDKIANSLGASVCNALLGMHAFTGCDTVSAFAGRGKATALKQMKNDWTTHTAFSQLGQTWEMTSELSNSLEAIVCKMYFPASKIANVNDLRYQVFCTKRGEVESSQLPPCQDCLYLHSLRANYQAGIWRRSLESSPLVPSPVDHGWMKGNDGTLSIDWMKGSPAPEAVLQFLSCDCVRVCAHPKCTCMANGLKCTEMCKLQSCTNQSTDQETTPELDSESDSDEDE
jgi:hypothetical protein